MAARNDPKTGQVYTLADETVRFLEVTPIQLRIEFSREGALTTSNYFSWPEFRAWRERCERRGFKLKKAA